MFRFEFVSKSGRCACSLGLMLYLLSPMMADETLARSEPIDFDRDVVPVLTKNCIQCHRAEKVRGGLRLDEQEAALKGGESGPVIEPGKDTSELLRRITAEDESERMPPEGQLKPEEIAALRKWILGGANWTTDVRLRVDPPPKAPEGSAAGTPKKLPRFPRPADAENVPLVPPAWATLDKVLLSADQLDKLLAECQEADALKRAPDISDEQFARRVYLDLAGRLPPPGATPAFVAKKAEDKRSILIDELLEHDSFAESQARYWRDVITANATEVGSFIAFPRHQGTEQWLNDQFRAHRSWADITRDLLTAEGELCIAEPRKGGALGFLFCHTMDSPIARANDTARVFLGLNVSCAQCHDAPEHVWKRDQFHELAAFFGRVTYKVNPNAVDNFNFISTIFAVTSGEYMTPDKYDDSIKAPTQPRFLTGETAPLECSDQERRAALASFVTSSYYFSAATVNRVWDRLMGEAFTEHMDDMDPLKSVQYQPVLLALAASFEASGHDIRSLYRTIMNSQAYQREFRVPASPTDQLRFTAICPAPVRADALWSSIENVLGPINGRLFLGKQSTLPLNPHLSLRDVFDEAFYNNPALSASEIEATYAQSLLLMNNPTINASIDASGETLLAFLLKELTDDEALIRALYSRAFGRPPTAQELEIGAKHVEQVGDRNKAFEDLVWTLINSAEFRTRH
ncbi:MAG: DUF1549 domain-containing protein [Pirellulaceae bacterium]|nr:DUF1549 domain-containing protein [Pirellulaceae bacterium]